MVEALVAPVGPYRLRHAVRSNHVDLPLPGGRRMWAWQRPDGRVVVRASDEPGLDEARFVLALDSDTGPFHERFAHDPLLGPSARALVGYRPLRLPTVAHAALRAVCGQLIEGRRARAIERAICRRLGVEIVTQEALATLAPIELRALGLGQHRATALARLVRSVELERLRLHPTEVVLRRLCAERGIGPWSVGVIALEGLGRFDHGLVGDLGLVKLHTALLGRQVEGHETAALLAPYGRWQGLAGEVLMRGVALGLVPGADLDAGRLARRKTRSAA